MTLSQRRKIAQVSVGFLYVALVVAVVTLII